jgi:hypothetical protein
VGLKPVPGNVMGAMSWKRWASRSKRCVVRKALIPMPNNWEVGFCVAESPWDGDAIGSLSPEHVDRRPISASACIQLTY